MNDTIGCFLDLDRMEIKWSKNGEWNRAKRKNGSSFKISCCIYSPVRRSDYKLVVFFKVILGKLNQL
jgi:hypothetical protein